jgi:hypothetical protein
LITAMVLDALLSCFGVGLDSEVITLKFSSTKAALISVPPMSTATTYLTEEVYLLGENN